MTTQTELYKFVERDSSVVWTFTSGVEEIVHELETYVPTKISRNDIEARNELARANIDIQVPLTNEAALNWLADNGEQIVTLTIFERDRAGVITVAWKGRLAAVIPGMNSIQLKMESIFTSLRRTGLRARYQSSCRHALYGRGCELDPEAFGSALECTVIEGTVITVPDASLQPSGYYAGGMLKAPDGTLGFVIEHSGDTITLQRRIFALESVAGDLPFDVTLYPGCAHNRTDCAERFDNILNYGGFDFIPVKNPMGGGSIV